MDEKMYKELTEFLRQKTEEYNETYDVETKAYLKGEINAINTILYRYGI